MKLKEYLQKKRIRQRELALQIHAPLSVINVFINGWKPLPSKYIHSLSTVLGISVSELMAREVQKEVNEQ